MQNDDLINKVESWLKSPITSDIDPAIEYANGLLKELQSAMQQEGASRKEIGSLIGKIKGTQNALKSVEPVNWVKIGNGYLAIGHRPATKFVNDLRLQNASHILTLLSEKEDARKIEALTKKNGLNWLWFPMESAEPPTEDRNTEVTELFRNMKKVLESEGRIYLHCSAGIHRTGMIGYAFLRYIGNDEEKSNKLLLDLRVETSEGVGEKRREWGNAIIEILK